MKHSPVPLLAALAFASAEMQGGEIFVAHNQIVVIDSAARSPVAEVPLNEVVNGIAFTPDGERAFVGTSGGKDPAASRGGLYLLDVAKRKVAKKLLQNPVKELRISPDGKRVHLLEWEVRTEERAGKKKPVKEPFQLRTLDVSGEEAKSLAAVTVGMDLYDLAISPDQKTAYFLDPGHNGLRILDLGSGGFVEVVNLSGGKKSDGTYFEAAPAKLVLASGGARAAVLQNGPSRTGVLSIDLDARTRRQVLFPHGSSLRAGQFLPDGKRMLAVSLGRLQVLDLEGGQLLQSLPLLETFTSLALSQDGTEVYLGAPVALKTENARGRGMVEVRDGESFALLTQISVPITVKFLQVAPARKPAER